MGGVFPPAERFDTAACSRFGVRRIGPFARLLCRKGSKMDKHFHRLCSLYPNKWPPTISTRLMGPHPHSPKTFTSEYNIIELTFRAVIGFYRC